MMVQRLVDSHHRCPKCGHKYIYKQKRCERGDGHKDEHSAYCSARAALPLVSSDDERICGKWLSYSISFDLLFVWDFSSISETAGPTFSVPLSHAAVECCHNPQCWPHLQAIPPFWV